MKCIAPVFMIALFLPTLCDCCGRGWGKNRGHYCLPDFLGADERT